MAESDPRPAGDDIVPLGPPEDIPYLEPGYDVPQPPQHLIFWIVLGVCSLNYVAALVLPTPLRTFAAAGLEVVPFLPLAVMANLGRQSGTFRVLTLLFWLFLAGLMLLFSVGMMFAIVADLDGLAHMDPKQDSLLDHFVPGGPSMLLQVGLLSSAAVGVGLCCFAGPVRRWAARWLPLESHSFTDATGLATAVAMTLGCLIPVIVLKAPPILLVLGKLAAKEQADKLAGSTSELTLYYRLFWTLPVVLIAAGFPLHRRFRETLRRLGVAWPTWWQWALIPLATAALAGALIGYEYAAEYIWKRMGWPTTDGKQFEDLMRSVINPAGAVAVAIVAGVTEELIFRGLFQPRIGLLLANLLFTAVHALQYNFDALLGVFIIGLVLGVIRKYTNTTTAAGIHGLYDFVMVMLAWYQMKNGGG